VPKNQFVIFQNVNIYQGAVAQITASPGVAGLASINGLQLLVKGPALPPPPKILEQPQGGVAFAGDRIVLNVSAQGENLQYQWSLNDVSIPGATQSTLEIASFSSADVGSYAVAVSGTTPAVGSSSQFSAMATLSTGATQDITSTASWSSSNTAVATVSSTGVVTALSSGGATIIATYSGVAGNDAITVP
jgi:hypothetical protein